MTSLFCEEEMLESPGGTDDIRTPRVQQSHHGTYPNLSYIDEMPSAFVDPAIVNDPRVLQNMLKVEERLQMHSFCYFKIVQNDITPEMRQAVTTWMYEVCEEEHLPDNVFHRAVIYLDRFLSIHKIQRNQFQLLGAACLLISSKWTGTVMSTDRLIFYTANSVTLQMLLDWEMMILAQFKWDTYTLTPHDFVDHILHRLPRDLWSAQNVSEKVKTYMAYCATDHKFRIHLPSIIASASIAAAIGNQTRCEVLNEVLHRLHLITNIETEILRSTMDQIRLKIIMMMGGENSEGPGQGCPGVSGATSHSGMNIDKLGEFEQAETPTDVGDIHF